MQVNYSPKQGDPIRMLIGAYTGSMKLMHPVQEGESAQAFNKRVQYGKGMRDAFADSFAVVIAQARISRYGDRMESIPSPQGYEIGADLLPAIEAGWEASMNKQHIPDVAAFYEALEPVLEQYVFPERLEEQYEDARRLAILDGQEKPGPGDEEWLKLKAEELENRAAKLRSLVE